jgi:uncharacterized protein with PIN domain
MKNNIQDKDEEYQPILRTSYFRIYEELNDFLPKQFKKEVFPFSFNGTPSVKNVIETIGIPHTEVDLILVNGKSVGFEYLLSGNELVSVYPVFESFDISEVIKLRPKPLRKIRFIVDVNLGKLAKKLRLLGFDTLYRNDLDDDEIVQISVSEKRIILTRDIGILKCGSVTHGTWIRNDDPEIQLYEVIERLQLRKLFKPFSRCSNCNGTLKRVNKENLNTRIPADTFKYYKTFWECTDCNQIYWEGSHFEKITGWIDELKSENKNNI